MAGKPDYYSILGVAKNATQDEIRKAFLKAARKYHPDLNKAVDAEERFKEVNEAYEVLGDAEKRHTYDSYGAGANGAWDGGDGQSYSWSASSTWEDILNIFRKGRAGRSKDAQAQATEDPYAESPDFGSIFDDVLFSNGFSPTGSSFTEAYSRVSGMGYDDPSDYYPQDGRRYAHMRTDPATDMEATLAVPLQVLLSGGTRRVSVDDRTVDVQIRKGTKPGTKIRLRGMGGDGENGRGDLYVTLAVDSMPKEVSIDGDNIHSDVIIPFQTAILGGRMTMSLPDGSRIKVTVPPGTSTGRRFSVKGHGFGQDGRCFLHTKISVPQNMSPSFYDGLRKLCDEEGLLIGE